MTWAPDRSDARHHGQKVRRQFAVGVHDDDASGRDFGRDCSKSQLSARPYTTALIVPLMNARTSATRGCRRRVGAVVRDEVHREVLPRVIEA